MKKSLLAVASAITILASGSVSAQTFSNGPYYATPSWDQQLPAVQRFIILQNWNNEAVLDRETGLVWERQPNGVSSQAEAFGLCRTKNTGNRHGWKLPTVEELSSLLDGLSLPAGHPFIGISLIGYWSSTTDEQDPTQAWFVTFSGTREPNATFKSIPTDVWCVRGGSNQRAVN